MQYALINLGKERMHLIDAAELRLIDIEAEGGSIPEVEDDESGAETREMLVYGAYMADPHVPSATVPNLAREAVGYGLGFYDFAANRLRCVELAGLLLGTPVVRHRSPRLPFAALLRVGTKEDLPWRKSWCITAFLRYADMKPGTNVLSRPGVFALTAPERRLHLKGDWQQRADLDRAARLALRIH